MNRANPGTPSEEKGGYYAKTRTEMFEFIPGNSKRLLDVGCAEGNFGAFVKERLGAEVWGIEIDGAAAAVAQKKLDTVLVGDISTLLKKLPDGYFDCIVCNDVLEHLIDPYSVLRTFKQKLCVGGVIVFSLPNVRYFGNLKNLLVRKDWQYADEGILDRTHLRFFTEKSIRKMFTQLGYAIVTMQGLRAIHTWKFSLLNLVVFGHLSDSRYLQFAGIATVEKNEARLS